MPSFLGESGWYHICIKLKPLSVAASEVCTRVIGTSVLKQVEIICLFSFLQLIYDCDTSDMVPRYEVSLGTTVSQSSKMCEWQFDLDPVTSGDISWSSGGEVICSLFHWKDSVWLSLHKSLPLWKVDSTIDSELVHYLYRSFRHFISPYWELVDSSVSDEHSDLAKNGEKEGWGSRKR